MDGILVRNVPPEGCGCCASPIACIYEDSFIIVWQVVAVNPFSAIIACLALIIPVTTVRGTVLYSLVCSVLVTQMDTDTSFCIFVFGVQGSSYVLMLPGSRTKTMPTVENTAWYLHTVWSVSGGS